MWLPLYFFLFFNYFFVFSQEIDLKNKRFSIEPIRAIKAKEFQIDLPNINDPFIKERPKRFLTFVQPSYQYPSQPQPIYQQSFYQPPPPQYQSYVQPPQYLQQQNYPIPQIEYPRLDLRPQQYRPSPYIEGRLPSPLVESKNRHFSSQYFETSSDFEKPTSAPKARPASYSVKYNEEPPKKKIEIITTTTQKPTKTKLITTTISTRRPTTSIIPRTRIIKVSAPTTASPVPTVPTTKKTTIRHRVTNPPRTTKYEPPVTTVYYPPSQASTQIPYTEPSTSPLPLPTSTIPPTTVYIPPPPPPTTTTTTTTERIITSTAEEYYGSQAVEQPVYDETFVGQYYYGRKGEGNNTFPLPSCFYNPSGYVCCNLMLNELMTTSFEKTKSAKVNKCNVQKFAVELQKHSEKIFNTQFETIVSYEDFSQKIHFRKDLVCKIEIEGRYILAYATPESVEQEKIIPTVPSRNIVKDSILLKQKVDEKLRTVDSDFLRFFS